MRCSLYRFLLVCMMVFGASMQAYDYNKICNNVFAYCREKYPERFEAASLEDCFMRMRMLCDTFHLEKYKGAHARDGVVIYRRAGPAS